ncbi:MAG: hypothetical protein KBE23_13140 [Chloroflexi bacterium]|nr:hypothetical protein [Chloroflexota bacterium]MBP7043684.1 hypothetical protein [Chloroflexota bacterium]
MAKKVFSQGKNHHKSSAKQSKGFSGSKKNTAGKQAANASFGDKVRGYWQRLFK